MVTVQRQTEKLPLIQYNRRAMILKNAHVASSSVITPRSYKPSTALMVTRVLRIRLPWLYVAYPRGLPPQTSGRNRTGHGAHARCYSASPSRSRVTLYNVRSIVTATLRACITHRCSHTDSAGNTSIIWTVYVAGTEQRFGTALADPISCWHFMFNPSSDLVYLGDFSNRIPRPNQSIDEPRNFGFAVDPECVHELGWVKRSGCHVHALGTHAPNNVTVCHWINHLGLGT